MTFLWTVSAGFRWLLGLLLASALVFCPVIALCDTTFEERAIACFDGLAAQSTYLPGWKDATLCSPSLTLSRPSSDSWVYATYLDQGGSIRTEWYDYYTQEWSDTVGYGVISEGTTIRYYFDDDYGVHIISGADTNPPLPSLDFWIYDGYEGTLEDFLSGETYSFRQSRASSLPSSAVYTLPRILSVHTENGIFSDFLSNEQFMSFIPPSQTGFSVYTPNDYVTGNTPDPNFCVSLSFYPDPGDGSLDQSLWDIVYSLEQLQGFSIATAGQSLRTGGDMPIRQMSDYPWFSEIGYGSFMASSAPSSAPSFFVTNDYSTVGGYSAGTVVTQSYNLPFLSDVYEDFYTAVYGSSAFGSPYYEPYYLSFGESRMPFLKDKTSGSAYMSQTNSSSGSITMNPDFNAYDVYRYIPAQVNYFFTFDNWPFGGTPPRNVPLRSSEYKLMVSPVDIEGVSFGYYVVRRDGPSRYNYNTAVSNSISFRFLPRPPEEEPFEFFAGQTSSISFFQGPSSNAVPSSPGVPLFFLNSH